MKTGRPGYWIPHPTTVARDVKRAFAKTRQRIAELLQVRLLGVCERCADGCEQKYPGRLHFATDGWTSGNHGAYIAITVHLLDDSQEPLVILLDFLEIAEVRTRAPIE